MVELFRAEWIKLLGNRYMSALILWIFPVGMLAFMVIGTLFVSFAAAFGTRDMAAELGFQDIDWTTQVIGVWNFPTGLFGRLLVLALTAIIFAGEYQWQTWKNVVPHNRRVPLVLVKFATVGFAVLFTFSLMSLIMGVGLALMTEIIGGTIGPALTAATIADFIGDYVQQALLAFTLTMISASIAALAGMFTRSILGGTLIGMFFTFIEGLSVVGLVLLGILFDYPRLVYLYRLTPSYNIANVDSWLSNHQPTTQSADMAMMSDFIDFADDLNFSVVLLMIWVVSLVAVTAYLFQRQDIT